MSLIEEALRKHREEQAAPKPAAAPNAEASSTPANPPALPENREHSHRSMLLVGINLLLVVGVLAAIVWGSWRLLMRAGQTPTSFQIGSGSVIAPSGTTVAVTIPTATTRPQHASNAIASTNRAPALTSDISTNGIATSAATVTSIIEVAVASTAQPPAQVTALSTPIALQPPAPPPRPIWPRLAVSGIMEATGNRSTAIVNGKLLRQGDSVQGASITEITRQGVRFNLAGETRLIRTGNAAD